MNKKLFYKSALFLLLYLLLPKLAIGQETVSKRIEESHDFSEKGSLLLENKYGDIYIKGWNNNTISIMVDISATDDDTKAAQELLDRIKPTIRVVEDRVVITSEIIKKEVGLIDRLFNKSKPSGKNSKSQIDYTLYLPNNSSIELSNKYGDVIVSEWNGTLDAMVEHGDIRLPDGIDNATLSLKYGKLKANTLMQARITANDANLEINNCKELKIDAKGSELFLDEINSLDISSNKDEITIEKIKQIEGTIKYSNVVVNEVGEKVSLDLELAEFRVLSFSTIEPTLRIRQENSEVYLNISNTSFQFRANLEQGVLRIPKTMENINSTMLDKKRKIRDISATYGSTKSSVFSFTGRKGIIILKEL